MNIFLSLNRKKEETQVKRLLPQILNLSRAVFIVLISVPPILAHSQQFQPLSADFFRACADVSGGTPILPLGWTAHPNPSLSDTKIVCNANGIGVIGSSLDTKLYLTMFNKLSTGSYVLTAAGGGPLVIVKNGFSDISFKARSRTVNLGSQVTIVNQNEFTWDGSTEADGLIEVWGTGLQWLRLERKPDNPQGIVLPVPTSTNTNGWVFSNGTTYVNSDSTVLLQNIYAPAQITRNFALPAGRYKVVMRTRGEVNIDFISGPEVSQSYKTLDERQRSGLTSDSNLSRFINASGQPVTVTLTANGSNQEFAFSTISITPVLDTPLSPMVLGNAKNRPSPWPARGVNVANVFDLLSAPKDRAGQLCSRSSNHTQDLVDLKPWGAKIVRMGVDTLKRATQDGCKLVNDSDIKPDGSINPDAFWGKAWPIIMDEIAQAVQMAREQDLKVVLLMEPPTPSMAIGTTTAGWVNLQSRKEFARGMSELVKRLSPLRRYVWAYDLYNEPYEFRDGIGNLPASQWRTLAMEVIFSIRAQEVALKIPKTQRSWIVFEPGLFPYESWKEAYSLLKPLPDARVLYSDHFYDPFDFTHQNICLPNYPIGTQYYSGNVAGIKARLQPLTDFSRRTGAPIYIGEFGAAVWAGWSEVLGADGKSQTPQQWSPHLDSTGQPDNVNWLRDVMDAINTFGFSWTQHSFKTYYSWNSEITPAHGPCGGYIFHQSNQPDTPAMSLMKQYLIGD